MKHLRDMLAARAGAADAAGLTEAPLSFAQERLWFLDRLAPGTSVYNTGFAIRLTGLLDRAALAGALTALVRRHSVLRTTFSQDEAGNARQRVSPAAEVPLSDLAPTATEEHTREICQDFLAQPFDLVSGPLLRAGLLALGEDHVLVVGMHHIVSDGWSHPILVNELRAGYNADAPTGSCPQYIDFAARQRRSGPDEAALRHWRQQLDGVPAQLDLPRDHRAEDDHRGGTVPVSVTAEQIALIRQLAAEAETTEFAVLMAVYQALLARYSGQDRFIIGFPVANRRSASEFDTVGFFVNTIAFPSDLREDPSLTQLIRRIGQELLASYEYQHAPYEQVVREIGGSNADVVQVLLAWQNLPEPADTWTGLVATDFPVAWQSAKFDLTLSLSQLGDRVEGYFEYRTAIFERPTIELLATNWSTLLDALLAAPDLPLSTVEFKGGAAALPVADWLASTDYDPAGMVRIDQLIDQWAPEDVAVRDSTTTLTWGQLRERVHGLAGLLVERGVSVGEVVGLCGRRGVDAVVAAVAVLRAGAAFLPLDPAAPAERHTRLLSECGVRLALVDDGADVLAGLGVERIAVSAAGPVEPVTLPEVGLDELAYVIYTSGSTGVPKGVLVPHRGVANLIRTHVRAMELTRDDRVLLAAAQTFDPWVFQTFMAFAAGAQLVVADEDQVAGSPLADLLVTQRVTVLNVTPTTAATIPVVDLPALRQVVVGGDACRVDIARRWARDRVLYNAYGPTEASISATLARFADTVDTVHIGSSFPNVHVYLLDEGQRPVGLGMVGEIHIGGAGLAWGYTGQPGMTAERFLPDPFTEQPGGRMYRTGDLGRWLAGGGIEFLGRRDRQVKIRGYRIEPAEIEAVLTATDGVTEAIVVPHTDHAGDTRLIGYVIGDAELAEQAHARARGELPRWMVPAAVVGLPEFPTRNGKIDREALPEPVWGDRSTQDREPPNTPIEIELAAIWARLLPVEPARADDFFLVGGHSLLATRLVFAISAAFGVEMSLRTVFEHTTLAEQAAWIDRAVDAELTALLADPATLLAEIELLEQLDDGEVSDLLSRLSGRNDG